MAQDRIGNQLSKGNKVLVNLNTTSMIGEITEVEEARLVSVVAGQPTMQPGRIRIAFEFDQLFHPEMGVPEIVRVVDPTEPKKSGILQ